LLARSPTPPRIAPLPFQARAHARQRELRTNLVNVRLPRDSAFDRFGRCRLRDLGLAEIEMAESQRGQAVSLATLKELPQRCRLRTSFAGAQLQGFEGSEITPSLAESR